MSAGSSDNQYIPKIIPPSPNAANLGKFTEIPVGLYNGIPEISIPLYNISIADINIPVSLSYHAGGIRVGEVAANVGLGWVLNAGGVISRTIMGLRDDSAFGYLATGKQIPTSGNCITYTGGETGPYYFCLKAAQNQIDTEPDIFYYNFGGYSGRFVFNQQGVIQTLPKNNLKFKQIGTTGNVGWEVTTEEGLIYKFSRQETTSTIPASDINDINLPNAWHLTEIKSAKSTEKVTFQYYSSAIEYKNAVSKYLEQHKVMEVLAVLGQY